MDIFERCLDTTQLNNYTAAKIGLEQGYYPYFHEITSRQHSEVTMEGRRTIMLGSNNYLGLTSDDRVIKAAQEALDRYGSGCSGSRFLNGTLTLHNEMERQLAEFFGVEDVVSFSTGFQANLGIISAIASRHDILFYDRYNHASLIDAARLSLAKLVKFDHNDMDDLERCLKQAPENAGKLIVVDGVFSMEGDLCDLPNIVRLAKQYGARVMVDDSHGIGTMGARGRGVAEHFGLESSVDLLMGTFSKSFASLGGFLGASREICMYVRHMSRPFIFSASMPPANVAAVMASLKILREEPERPKRGRDNAEYMRQSFARLNIPAGGSESPIVPVFTYDAQRTFWITRALFESGVYVNPVIPPAVPEGGALLRTSYTATHTREQLGFALEQFEKVFAAAPAV